MCVCVYTYAKPNSDKWQVLSQEYWTNIVFVTFCWFYIIYTINAYYSHSLFRAKLSISVVVSVIFLRFLVKICAGDIYTFVRFVHREINKTEIDIDMIFLNRVVQLTTSLFYGLIPLSYHSLTFKTCPSNTIPAWTTFGRLGMIDFDVQERLIRSNSPGPT